MRLGMVGLGRMGANMTRRLLRGGHEVVVTNRSREPIDELSEEGAIAAHDYEAFVDALPSPRVAWAMVPEGAPTQQVTDELSERFEAGDVIVDGGNSRYRDSMRRAEELAGRGIAFLDAGTSGGIWGLDEGYCLMVGGDPGAFEILEPAVATLAPDGGYAHVGPSGAGHFVKMVHNGIEYGMLQAYGEGFEILASADEFSLDLAGVAELWRHGSVVRSWLGDLLASALAEDPRLEGLQGYVEDSGEGRWTVQDAVERAVPATSIAHALFARFASRQDDSFAMRVIAALRREFGGHATKSDEG